MIWAAYQASNSYIQLSVVDIFYEACTWKARPSWRSDWHFRIGWTWASLWCDLGKVRWLGWLLPAEALQPGAPACITTFPRGCHSHLLPGQPAYLSHFGLRLNAFCKNTSVFENILDPRHILPKSRKSSNGFPVWKSFLWFSCAPRWVNCCHPQKTIRLILITDFISPSTNYYIISLRTTNYHPLILMAATSLALQNWSGLVALCCSNVLYQSYPASLIPKTIAFLLSKTNSEKEFWNSLGKSTFSIRLHLILFTTQSASVVHSML